MSPLDSPLTDSGTCTTELESTALMMCMVCVHGHSPLCLVPLPPYPLLHMRLCHVHLQVHIKCQQQKLNTTSHQQSGHACSANATEHSRTQRQHLRETKLILSLPLLSHIPSLHLPSDILCILSLSLSPFLIIYPHTFNIFPVIYN